MKTIVFIACAVLVMLLLVGEAPASGQCCAEKGKNTKCVPC